MAKYAKAAAAGPHSIIAARRASTASKCAEIITALQHRYKPLPRVSARGDAPFRPLASCVIIEKTIGPKAEILIQAYLYKVLYKVTNPGTTAKQE
jgi:hypothetical protein